MGEREARRWRKTDKQGTNKKLKLERVLSSSGTVHKKKEVLWASGSEGSERTSLAVDSHLRPKKIKNRKVSLPTTR